MPTIDIARERSLYTEFADRGGPALQRDLSRLREQVSTGKRINRPSDDPDGFAVAQRMKALENRYAQHERAIASARPWVDRTQEELDQMADLFSEAYEKGLLAANRDGHFVDGRAPIVQRLEGLRAKIVDGLNAQHNDEYLFAGNRTAQAPFAADGQPTAGYPAIDGARERPVGAGRMMQVNVTGAQLHQVPGAEGGTTLTGALDGLIAAVRGGEAEEMEAALERTEAVRDHVVDLGAAAGATAERLTTAEEQLRTASLTVEQRRSKVEDADYLETLTALQEKQTHLQAALKVTASTLQTSLVDFLR